MFAPIMELVFHSINVNARMGGLEVTVPFHLALEHHPVPVMALALHRVNVSATMDGQEGIVLSQSVLVYQVIIHLFVPVMVHVSHPISAHVMKDGLRKIVRSLVVME